jgi:glyoxylase-like metal-dependent hydrolase (beta-lactamase superfamily II)
MIRYNYMILQEGTLPLRANGLIIHGVEHRSTTALIWREGEKPNARNTIVTDPYFTNAGFANAMIQLKSLGLTIADIGYYFVTHQHWDHMPHVPPRAMRPKWLNWDDVDLSFPDLDSILCPGHESNLQALGFRSTRDETVLVVGDAVLDLEWLRAWQYYWPNGYSDSEIIQTWRSVAKILSADIIIPGHGAPIRVTRALLEHLHATFPAAEHASECRDVLEAIGARLQSVRGD